MPSSLTMSLSTPWYALPGHVCPFAVRVPVRLSLAGFLGSRITRTLGPPRMERRTFRFGSGRVLNCAPRRLHPSTRSSVCARRCHFSVAASPARAVTESQPCLPSPSPFGLGLGPDLPRDDWHRPGNLGLAAGGVRAPLVVTHTYICLSRRSSTGRPMHSAHLECSPTDTFFRYPAPSASALYPIIIHASPLDQ